MSLLSFLKRQLSAVQIRNEYTVALGGDVLCVGLDLVVNPPPLLDGDNGGLANCEGENENG